MKGRQERKHAFILDLKRFLAVVWVILKSATGPVLRWLLHLPQRGRTPVERLRVALEELGLAYLKLGQYLATRFDLFPEEVCREMAHLFENVRPLTFAEVVSVIESELNQSVEQAFRSFDPEPLASASVAQVHRAVSHSKQKLAVKIQRPGIEELFKADIRNLRRLALLADAMSLLGRIPIRELIDEFSKWTLRELDFLREGQTAEALRNNSTPTEVVPQVFWQLTTSRVLTMEFLDGVSLAKIADLIETGQQDEVSALLPNLDVAEGCRNLANAVLNQFFVIGLFHGDPHPGNILLRDDHSVGFVDFGIFGELSEYEREVLAAHIENIAIGNIDASFRYYAKLCFPSEETDFEKFEREGKAVLSRWYQASQNPNTKLRDRHMGKYSGEMLNVTRRNQMRMSLDTLLFWRALNTLDSSALRLSGLFDILEELRIFFKRLRPSFGDRIVNVLTDRTLGLTGLQIQSDTPTYLRTAIDGVFQRRVEFLPRLQESPQLFHHNTRVTKALTAAISGFSITILATHLSSALGALSLIVTLIWCGALVRQFSRR